MQSVVESLKGRAIERLKEGIQLCLQGAVGSSWPCWCAVHPAVLAGHPHRVPNASQNQIRPSSFTLLQASFEKLPNSQFANSKLNQY